MGLLVNLALKRAAMISRTFCRTEDQTCSHILHALQTFCLVTLFSFFMSENHWGNKGLNAYILWVLPSWRFHALWLWVAAGPQGTSCHMDGRSARDLEKSVWSRGDGVVVYVDWIHLWNILIPYWEVLLSDLHMLSYIFLCTVSYGQEKPYVVGSLF